MRNWFVLLVIATFGFLLLKKTSTAIPPKHCVVIEPSDDLNCNNDDTLAMTNIAQWWGCRAPEEMEQYVSAGQLSYGGPNGNEEWYLNDVALGVKKGPSAATCMGYNCPNDIQGKDSGTYGIPANQFAAVLQRINELLSN